VYVLEGVVESTFGTVTVTLERLLPLEGRRVSAEVPVDTEAANLCDSGEEV
jgi:hypothetical protein